MVKLLSKLVKAVFSPTWPRIDRGLCFIENSVLFELGFPQCVSLLAKQAWLINTSSLLDAEGTYAHGIACAVSALCRIVSIIGSLLCISV